MGLFRYTNGKLDFFYSKDMKEEDGLDNELSLEIVSSDALNRLLRALSERQAELINLYSKKNNLERIAVLHAHGDSEGNKWVYYNGENSHSMQRWIGQQDGKYKIIILTSCNPGQNEINSKKSIVLAPNKTHCMIDFEAGNVQLELFVPGIGYVNNYIVDDEIEKLKKYSG